MQLGAGTELDMSGWHHQKAIGAQDMGGFMHLYTPEAWVHWCTQAWSVEAEMERRGGAGPEAGC